MIAAEADATKIQIITKYASEAGILHA
jgi:hypothetical protein